tara:strand:+ start:153 stop:311 length:159 start_codon:yes stop_codon:yes gene_type:complete
MKNVIISQIPNGWDSATFLQRVLFLVITFKLEQSEAEKLAKLSIVDLTKLIN